MARNDHSGAKENRKWQERVRAEFAKQEEAEHLQERRLKERQKHPKDLDLIRGAMAAKSFLEFVRLFWPLIEPAEPLEEGFWLEAICEHIEGLAYRSIQNLIINLPPRHSKSTLATMVTAWRWISAPQERFLCSSYALELSIRDNRRCRNIIESPLYQKCYGGFFGLQVDENRKDRFENDKTGFRLAHSIDSFGLGEGGSWIILDDPNDINKIYSQAEREKVIRWYREIMSTRLNSSKGVQLLIQQRCHESDLTGWILDHDAGNDWCVLSLPFTYDPARSARNKLGWKDPREQPGQALSRRLSSAQVPARKAALGSVMWRAQYEQMVTPSDGATFKTSWFRYFDETPSTYELLNAQGKIVRVVNKSDCWYFATVDLAISTKQSADWTVVAVFAVDLEHNLILTHVVRKRMEAVETLSVIEETYHHYGLSYVGVEDVAFQRIMIQQARMKGLAVRPLKPQGADKLSRSVPLQVRMENGQLFMPKDKAWMQEVEAELLSFPGGRHDDCIDCLSYAAIQVSRMYARTPKKEESADEKRKRWEEQEREGQWRALWEGVI